MADAQASPPTSPTGVIQAIEMESSGLHAIGPCGGRIPIARHAESRVTRAQWGINKRANRREAP